MSILSDEDILVLQREEHIIEPFDTEYLQPSSYDLHFDIQKRIICPPLQDNRQIKKNFKRIVVPPQELVLISTKECIFVPKGYVARVEGVSSLGRIGLLIHITSGFVDPNFKGFITLEVVNLNRYPILLNNGCKIAQIVFEKLETPNFKEYSGKSNNYQNQKDTKASKYEKTFTGSSYFIKK